jgi:uncharacterized membrane protein YgcG
MITKMIGAKRILLPGSLFLLILILSGCGTSKLIESTRPDKEMTLTGELSEFGTSMQLDPDKNFLLGFKNDDKYLYLCLATEDRSKIFQMMRSGFIVWFEPESKDYKTFGIKYPLANTFEDDPASGLKTPDPNREGNQGARPAGGMSLEKLLETHKELEVVNQDKYPLLAMPLENKEGIKINIGFKQGKYIYEMKVPLAVSGDYSFVAGAVPGEKIRVRFETQLVNADREEGEEGAPRHNGGSPGGMGGMGGGRGGGRRGGGGGNQRPGMGRSGSSAPINYSVEVKLAEK